MPLEVLRHIGPRIDRNAEIVEGAAAAPVGPFLFSRIVLTATEGFDLPLVAAESPFFLFVSSTRGQERSRKRCQTSISHSLGTGCGEMGSLALWARFGDERHLGCSEK